MDIRKVKKLIELLEESSLAEIEIHEGEESVRISRGVHQVAVPAPVNQVMPPAPAQAPAESSAPEPAAAPDEEAAGTPVKSPIVGTFYRSPGPGEPSFVEEGATVKQGDTLCIIEAMKMMNHIDAPVSGTVTKIWVKDADPVEYGQILVTIE